MFAIYIYDYIKRLLLKNSIVKYNIGLDLALLCSICVG